MTKDTIFNQTGWHVQTVVQVGRDLVLTENSSRSDLTKALEHLREKLSSTELPNRDQLDEALKVAADESAPTQTIVERLETATKIAKESERTVAAAGALAKTLAGIVTWASAVL